MLPGESPDSELFDVAVIGSGIAGAFSALLCARAGLRTVLLERSRFPRDKVCGCCINRRAISVLSNAGLDSGLQELQPTTITSVAVRYGSHTLSVPIPHGYAVSRKSLDQFIACEAVKAGCTLIDDVTATVNALPSECDHWLNEITEASVPDYPEVRQIDLRFAQSQNSSPNTSVFARIVLACDGLGHPSLHQLTSFSATPESASRIGLGAIFSRTVEDNWIRNSEILMAISPHGYVGVVEIEEERFNLAAAIDPSFLQQTNSPFDALSRIFESAGIPVPAQLRSANFKGTLPLTRTARRVSGHRLFLLGDATGYVEPFTGEGIAWALSAASAIAPIALAIARDGWSDEFVNRWQTTIRNCVGTEQKTCRLLAKTLRHTRLLPAVMMMCRSFPSLTNQLVRRINRAVSGPDLTR